jgi:hypothetical protein
MKTTNEKGIRHRWILVAGTLLMTLAACSPATLTEQILESQEGIDNIEIDEEDGTIKIEVSDEEGSGSVSIGGGDIPDGFPIPVPDGGTVMAVLEQESNFTVSLSYSSADFDAIKAFYEKWIDSSGFEVVNKFETSAPKSVSWGFENGGDTYNISVAEAGEDTFVNLFVTEG